VRGPPTGASCSTKRRPLLVGLSMRVTTRATASPCYASLPNAEDTLSSAGPRATMHVLRRDADNKGGGHTCITARSRATTGLRGACGYNGGVQCWE
jgi:hypothetical protein